ncbi:MAG: DUF3488 domain-containing protein [Geobacter sp.]|nr:DUF3488 domain-containing protein [Geobacter sp.]
MIRIDTLSHILLYCAAIIGYLPLAPYLHRLPAIALPAAILAAVIAGSKGLFLKERPALLLATGLFLYYALQFNRHNIAIPAANLLASLQIIRLVGEKSARNILQSITLALFCLAASTLFDLSPRFVIYLLLLLLIFTVSLVLLTFQSAAPGFRPDRRELRSIIAIALLQPLTALPLIFVLFFILPRTQLPLWSGISMVGGDRPGISDSVQPGDKSSVSTSGATLLRVEMPKIGVEDLYWRAMVLNTPEGGRWVRREPPGSASVSAPPGRAVRQSIYLEANRNRYLPALDLPQSISGTRSEPSADRLYTPSRSTSGRLSYTALSRTAAVLVEKSINRKFYTTLPANLPDGLKRISAQAATAGTDRERLQLVEDAFRKLGLAYSATDLPTGDRALEKFLFVTRKGHCELFATAFVAALRGAGVPARLVGGYFGGDYNELAGYYAIAEERAHLWTEVWLAGEGWLRVDPSRFARNFGEARQQRKSTLLHRLQLTADTLSYYWNRVVITYDLESQFEVARAAGERLRGLRQGRPNYGQLVKAGAAILLLTAGLLFWRRTRQSPEERLLTGLARVLRSSYGIDLSPTTGLHKTIENIDNPALHEFVAIYTGAVYRDRALTAAEVARLKSLLQELRIRK